MKTYYDLIIIGKGPAGISCAIYAKRGGLDTMIISKGQSALDKADKIQNYYGTSPTMDASELLNNGYLQASNLDIPIIEQEVVNLEWQGDFVVSTSEQKFSAKTVVLATGSPRRMPKIKGLADFEGAGVSYCAVCDAFFYRGKTIAVLGNSLYALHELEALREMTEKQYVLTNGETSNLDFGDAQVINKKISEMTGHDHLENIIFEDGTSLQLDGLFVALGQAQASNFAKTLGIDTQDNHIKVDKSMATNIPGLFSAGDCNGGWLQICKSVYEGAIAGMSAIKFVKAK